MLMDCSVDVSVSLPGLRAARAISTSLHTGVKEHYGRWSHRERRHGVVGSRQGLALRSRGASSSSSPATSRGTSRIAVRRRFSVVTLPSSEVEDVVGRDKATTLAQLEPGDERAAPFHRLVDAAMSSADRFSLEVALAEVIGALAGISGARPEQSRPVRRAMEHIRARLADAITLGELAEHAGLDKFHLCRTFRAQIGMPPHAYMTHLRVARAKELLLEGERAADVAVRVGFYDQAQLTRHFRKLVGTTPARWAKRIV